MNNYDAIVIGGGPAGISNAIYLKRYNYNPVVITSSNSSLEKAKIENYYGIESISGEDLLKAGVNQAKKLGIDVIEAEVTAIDAFGGINVKTTAGSFSGKVLFLGLGKARNKLTIKGASEFLGSGISMCATCDGFFYKKKNIGILGEGNFMEEELEVLKRFTPNITIFTNGKDYENSEFKVVTKPVLEVKGDTKLQSLVTEDGEYPLDGLFVALGTANALDFAKHMGIELDDKNNIVVNADYMTNVPGVFAGGDVIGGMLQVVKAVSDGAQAALAMKKYLSSLK